MKFTSNGKLLLAGEYLVLKGAKAFAVPVNFKQSMAVENSNENSIRWESYANEKLWFTASINPKTFEIIETSDIEVAGRLLKILQVADKMSNGFIGKQNGIKIINDADFNLNWGLGSSSTLISNIAYWIGIDPFKLHFETSGGSGYDVACARSNGPVFYSVKDKIPATEKVNFNPEYASNIFFVWLGQKKSSDEEVASFAKIKKKLNSETQEISQLSNNFAYAPTLEDFEYYMKEHELIISTILKMKPVREMFFKDFSGEIKSLGAWGGDFIMVTSDRPLSYVKNYFAKKGLNTVLTFNEMVKVW